jgi:hypothetical protein
MAYKLPANVKYDKHGLPTIPPDGRSFMPVITDMANGASIIKACNNANINPMMFWHWRAQSPELDAAAKMALEIGGERDMDRAEQCIDDMTNDNVQVNREKVRFYQARAGKKFARLYGDKQQPVANVQVNVNIADAIRQATAIREIDAQPIRDNSASSPKRRARKTAK